MSKDTMVPATKTKQELIVQTLKDLLGLHYPEAGKFGLKWVRWSRCEPASIRSTYEALMNMGLNSRHIANNVTLLALPSQTVRETGDFLTGLGLRKDNLLAFPQLLCLNKRKLADNYRNLCCLGLDRQLGRCPSLLYKSPGTLKSNLAFLRAKGVPMEKILANALLLASNTETIQQHWDYLRDLGLSDQKIATNAHLLQMSRKTIGRNYENLRRFLTRCRIITFAPLLGIPPETIDNSLQFLGFLGIDPKRYTLALMTSARTKRLKVARLVKLLSGHDPANPGREQVLRHVCRLVRDNPKLLIYSVATLDGMREKLEAKLHRSDS